MYRYSQWDSDRHSVNVTAVLSSRRDLKKILKPELQLSVIKAVIVKQLLPSTSLEKRITSDLRRYFCTNTEMTSDLSEHACVEVCKS